MKKSISLTDTINGLHFLLLHAWISYHIGHFETAQKEITQVIDLARRLNNQHLLSTALDTAGRMNYYLGYFDIAWEQLTEAIDLAITHHFSPIATSSFLSRGIILRSFSAYELARDEFIQAVRHAKSHTNALTLNAASVYLALIEGDLGNLQQSIEMLQALISDFRNTNSHYLRLQTEISLYHQCVTCDPQEIHSGPLEQEIKRVLQEVENRNLVLLMYYARLTLALHSQNHGNKILALNLLHQCVRMSIDQKLNVLELSADWYLHQFTGKLDEPVQERMKFLISELEENLKNPDLVHFKSTFIGNMQSKLHDK